ncbi:hypothetical protein BRADI_3g39530v3 [Brachypodium distachyon]|uniref:Neprosin PEP catalytic domain-containing protein n=1 Tax=Brachypodium distachyon TaxID=15368 RepID=A0A0Q3FGS1_BRADI|nr:hypothetical protein BRADI_3g39530v3 [Brachypodium distachyon]
MVFRMDNFNLSIVVLCSLLLTGGDIVGGRIYAANQIRSRNTTGSKSTIEVDGFTLDVTENSGAALILKNRQGFNYFSVGWHAPPGLYNGDLGTHFFVFWTWDRYGKTGCFNLDCPGFVVDKGATILPGSRLQLVSHPYGVKRTITLRVLKDKGMYNATGDWLIHGGLDYAKPHLIGSFPKSLLEKATEIQLSGFVSSLKSRRLVPMGSGVRPGNPQAASFRSCYLLDQNGQRIRSSQHFVPYMTDEKIYSLSPMSPVGAFSYGGPDMNGMLSE